MKKIFIAIMLIMSTITVLCSCGKNKKNDIEKKDVYKVNVVMDNLESEYNIFTKMGLTASTSEIHKIELSFTSDINDDTADAYIVVRPCVDAFLSAHATINKPIVTIGANDVDERITSNIGYNIEDAAKTLGQMAVNMARDRGFEKVSAIVLAGKKDDVISNGKINGFKDGIEINGGEFRGGDTQYLDGASAGTYDAMKVMMQRNPEGISIVCANTDKMAYDASFTCKGVNNYSNTIFVGFGGLTEACEAIKNNYEDISVGDNPYENGYKAIEIMLKILDGEEAEKHIASDVTYVTKENANEVANIYADYINTLTN